MQASTARWASCTLPALRRHRVQACLHPSCGLTAAPGWHLGPSGGCWAAAPPECCPCWALSGFCPQAGLSWASLWPHCPSWVPAVQSLGVQLSAAQVLPALLSNCTGSTAHTPAAFRQGTHAAHTRNAPTHSHKVAVRTTWAPKPQGTSVFEVSYDPPACCCRCAGAQLSAPAPASGRHPLSAPLQATSKQQIRGCSLQTSIMQPHPRCTQTQGWAEDKKGPGEPGRPASEVI